MRIEAEHTGLEKVEHHYLKHSEQRLGKVVKGASPGLVKVEFTPKQLHAQQGEDDDEEEEKEQQGSDGANRVQQGCHQVGQGVPISKQREIWLKLLKSSCGHWVFVVLGL